MNGGFYGFLCFCICFAYLTFMKESGLQKQKGYPVYPNFANLLKTYVLLAVMQLRAYIDMFTFCK